MLNVSEDSPELIRFNRALDGRRYASNTKRLYKWQGKKFFAEMQEKKIKPQDLDRAAELYLRRLRMKHSRTYFLQACSSVELFMEKGLKQPLQEDVLRKLQSA